jgi:hypothetical protein
MRPSTQTSKQPGHAPRLGDWWRNWTCRRRKKAERDSSYLPAAHNDYVTGAKPQVLAGKWPDPAAALSRRIPQIDKVSESPLAAAPPFRTGSYKGSGFSPRVAVIRTLS